MASRLATVVVVVLATACGGPAKSVAHPGATPGGVDPGHDLADAGKRATPDPTGNDRHLGAAAGPGDPGPGDPKVTNLDIIRIQVTGATPTGEAEVTAVAAADLFAQATQAAKAGQGTVAIGLYRRLVTDFSESTYAPLSLFNIGAVYDGQGDWIATVGALQELVKSYPGSRESVQGHLYMAALQADHQEWADARATLDAALLRPNLSYADRIEAQARRGYVLLQQDAIDLAEKSLQDAVATATKAPHVEDRYYVAMAYYYLGEVEARRFAALPIRVDSSLGDEQLGRDLAAKDAVATAAYDRWRDALTYRHAYWATASGYQMSQIFVELWKATVTAPYPRAMSVAARNDYVREVHERVRGELQKALDGHRMNVELATAYGVDTSWSRGSQQQAAVLTQLLADETQGVFRDRPTE